ncbi:MAG TPA: cytidine deaminase [Anaerolineaceae bacterium]|nr:cytidine deaminase [Anaerolineaceae bacterium]HPN51270.1 cytidine deaminase [Anaerolineaceae bacterium]
MLNDEMRTQLIETAILARRWAYCPYSKYAVGAALLTASGKIYDGVNIENAAYPSGICAERVAIFKAVSEGEREFEAIVVLTENGGSPCGACRQVIAEFGVETLVILADKDGHVVQEAPLREFLPGAFTPKSLS